MLQFLFDNPHYSLPPLLIIWAVLFFARRHIWLVVTSILLLALNVFFILNLPRLIFLNIQYGIDFHFFLRCISVACGVWGIVRAIREAVTMVVDNERVIESANYMVEQGAGHEQWVLGKTEEFIINARMPGVTTEQKDVSIGLFGEKRKYLVIRHARYKQFRMLIGARSFGENLDGGWFLVVEPSFFKRAVSRHVTGNPTALSQKLDFFSQQDVKAFKTVAHQCFKRALNMLYEELKLDPSGLDDPRGYMNVW